jgi:hypothetical protein
MSEGSNLPTSHKVSSIAVLSILSSAISIGGWWLMLMYYFWGPPGDLFLFLMGGICVISLLGPPVGIVLGIIALFRIGISRGELKGRIAAWFGIILGLFLLLWNSLSYFALWLDFTRR